MKRYDFVCEDCGCGSDGTERPGGEWVRAEVAQALRDSLSAMVDEFWGLAPTRGSVDIVDKARKAICIADGEDNG